MNDALVIEVVLKSVTVDCAIEEAFRIYTVDTMSWWPVATHSIYETVSEIVFEPEVGGEVYEISTSGDKGHWATVREWDPPHRLVLAWNILERDAIGTEVEIRFLPDGAGTRVEVEHRGWEQLTESAAEKRDDYDRGWDYVLGKYVDRVT
jgi:uncharacterized protein YndB with AHSA1/START domain